MRKRRLWWAVTGLAVLVTVGAFVLWPQPERVRQENFERIQVGMTLAQTEAILGPPGDYATGETQILYLPGLSLAEHHRIWNTNEGTLTITFVSDIVRYKRFDPHDPPDPRSLDNLLWRAKRQLRKWFPER
jgi:hypothetical protein